MSCPKCGKSLWSPSHALMELCDGIGNGLLRLSGFFGSLAYYFDLGKWPRS